MSTSAFHVVVIGGGIAGLCLAQGLKQAGVSVAVYERDRSRTDRLEGFRLHINPAGSRALHACLPPAVWEDFVATAGESANLGFLSERLRELLVIEDESMRPETAEQERAYAADRVTLRQLLLTGLDDVVKFDKTFTHYEVRGDKVTALFADGGSATGDLLVGADGANSRVRRQYLPQAERIESGALGVAWKLPLTDRTRAWLPPRLASGMNMIIAPAPYFLFTSAFDPRPNPLDAPSGVGGEEGASGLGPEQRVAPTRDYRSYLLCAFTAQPDAYPPGVRDLDSGGLRRVVEAMIVGWHPDLRRLIAESDPESVMLVPYLNSVPVPPWASTNVTLIGDAIHSMPPVGGLGGNAALRDAHLLCRTLTTAVRGRSPLPPAIQRYEAETRDYGFAAVLTALQAQQQGLNSNRVLVAGQKLWFRLCHAVPSLRRLNLPYADWAHPRPWERDPPPWAHDRRLTRQAALAPAAP